MKIAFQSRPGVFIDDIKHLLVVATPIEIILLGVAVSPNGRGDLTLIPASHFDSLIFCNLLGHM